MESFREIVSRNSFQVKPGNELFHTFGLSKDLGRILEVNRTGWFTSFRRSLTRGTSTGIEPNPVRIFPSTG
ncbi:MAG: hypothetical protein WBH59_02595 [Atribacterales bacterium]